MVQQPWVHENRRILVCVDAYDNGVLQGRFYTAYQEMETFESLCQLLVRMESILEESQGPQSYTAFRSFATIPMQEIRRTVFSQVRPGNRATFELQILFRQHSSWQGLMVWQDRRTEQSFRSVLEMVLLMDSALRDMGAHETVYEKALQI